MPAFITHGFFGRDVYDRHYKTIGGQTDQAQAFFLGNQGPDPLFYLMASPWLRKHLHWGSTMHHDHPSQVIKAFYDAVETLPAEQQAIGRAYALGFLCHYTLDATAHPLVYCQEFAICDAGVEGLSRNHGNEVHAIIESEWDEVVLFTKRGETVASFNAAREMLRGSNDVLKIISGLYSQVIKQVWGQEIPAQLFTTSVHNFRMVQQVFYSPTGTKRALLGRAERLARPYSFCQSMSMRPVEATTCTFDNHDNQAWENPFTGEVSKRSFWELYYSALAVAEKNLAAFNQQGFDLEQARQLTGGLNFAGEPVEGEIAASSTQESTAGE